MVTYSHPGILLKKRLKDAKIKANFLAGKLGVANSQFVDILNGKRRLTPRIAIGLERELGVKALELVRLQAEYDLALEKSEQVSERISVSRPQVALSTY